MNILYKCSQCELFFEATHLSECPVCGLPDVHKVASYPKIERKIEETEET